MSRRRSLRPGPETITHLTRGGRVIVLPAKFEVCDRCRGNGTHVNPAIDGNGLSREDFDEDPDFEEAYFAGHYDVRCEVCNGDRVIKEFDYERLSKREKLLVDFIEEDAAMRAQSDADDRYTRRMENGGRE